MLSFTATIPNDFALSTIRGRKTHFQIFDTMGELADHAKANTEGYSRRFSGGVQDVGGLNLSGALKAFRDGDMGSVARSDALLSEMEGYEIDSARRVWRDDVAGATPNVQAFIAGHPMNMRRRTRTLDAAAPIAIIVDIAADANVAGDQINKRGAAILALVRTLAARRPLELWAGAILDADNRQNASATFCKIETAPLDLAHAGFILTHPAALRRVLWSSASAHGFVGSTPYSAGYAHRPHTAGIIEPAFPHVSEILCVPRAHYEDKPAKAWLAQQLALHCPELAG